MALTVALETYESLWRDLQNLRSMPGFYDKRFRDDEDYKYWERSVDGLSRDEQLRPAFKELSLNWAELLIAASEYRSSHGKDTKFTLGLKEQIDEAARKVRP